MYPATLPITDDWAESSIRSQIQQQAAQQIQQQFPLLPPQEVNAQAAQSWRDFKETNADQYESQKKQLADQFRQRLQHTVQREDGTTYDQTYLLAIDPYYYLRRAENVAESGEVCDEIKDGDCIDNRMLAPEGLVTQNDYHSFLGGAFIVIAGLFGYAAMTGMFFVPAIIASLSTIPAFFIVKRSFGSFGGFISAMIVGLHTIFLGRTPAGFADTDAYNVFFPLYIIWLLLIGVDRKDKWGYASIAAAAILTGIYSKFWAGWYFTFILLFLTLLATAGFHLIRALIAKYTDRLDKKQVKPLLGNMKHAGIDLGIYVVVTGIVTTIVAGFGRFVSAFLTPVSISVGLQDPVGAALWPNVLTTVAELGTVSLQSIVAQLGGRTIFLLAILGVFIYAFTQKDKDWKYWLIIGAIFFYYVMLTSQGALRLSSFMYLGLFTLPLIGIVLYNLLREDTLEIHYLLFLMGWFVASIFATTQGGRFLMLLVPILGLSIGYAASWLKESIPQLLEKELELPKLAGQLVVILVICALLFAPAAANLVGRAHSVAKSEVPSMNDAWWNALTSIKEDSQPDAIITSWWDFGHWFKYVTDRRVTFDGASQKGEQAHWVGRLFQTSDPEESIGILRMLNCGGHTGYYELDKDIDDHLRSYRIIEQLLGISREDARAVLIQEGLDPARAEQVLDKTHCQAPESYVIVSEDMIGKAGVWGHFGLWDVERSFVYQTTKEHGRTEATRIISERLDVDQARAEQLYTAVTTQPNRRAINNWISGWPGIGGVSGCQERNGTTVCGLGMNLGQQQGVTLRANTITIDHEVPENSTISIVAQGQTVGQMRPSTLIYDDETYQPGGDFPLAIKVTDGRAILADQNLVDSQFIRWFFLEEQGPYLELLDNQRQVNGGKIIVYKVDWDAYLDAIDEDRNVQ